MNDVTEMSEKIIVIIAGGVGVNIALFIGAFLGSWKLIGHRLTAQENGLVKLDEKIDAGVAKLERRIERHNGFAERVARIEGEIYGRRRDDIGAEHG